MLRSGFTLIILWPIPRGGSFYRQVFWLRYQPTYFCLPIQSYPDSDSFKSFRSPIQRRDRISIKLISLTYNL